MTLPTALGSSRRGLLRKLTMMAGAVAALTVCVIAAAMIHFQERSIMKELEGRARDVAQNLSADASAAALADDFALYLERSEKMVRSSNDLRYVVLTELDGHSFVRLQDSWREEANLGSFWRPSNGVGGQGKLTHSELTDGRVLHYSQPVSVGQTHWGWLHVGLALDHYEQSVRWISQVTGFVAGGTFVLASLASFLLARNITEPIRTLQQFAVRVASGATSARVQIASNDEISDLADAINTMIGSIQSSQEKLHKSLEEQSSLREKDILLREIHHRVKNNMQMLSSLMRLQARRASTDEAREILRESEARIRSMGLIHEKLYQSESISSIDMHGYLKTLTDEILRMSGGASGGGAGRREVRLSVPGIGLGSDTALPCGLMVTELVQNSMKYAFPDGRDGVILVALSRNPAGEFSLVVCDNGVGFPADFDPMARQSLGMRLVRMLTDQLHGRVTISGEQGTRTEVSFRETQYRERL